MTAKERFRRSSRSFFRNSFALLPALALVSCATPKQTAPTEIPKIQVTSLPETTSGASDTKLPELYLTGDHGEIVKNEVVDGSVVLVVLKLPTDVSEDLVEGEFGKIELPFFRAKGRRSKRKISGNVYEAVLGVPYDYKPGPAEIKVKFGNYPALSVPVTVVDGHYPSEKLKVTSRLVIPPASVMNRIHREQHEVGVIYREITRRKYWKGPFSMPIQSKVTDPFGTRRIYNGELRGYHGGLDLRAKKGTPIYSSAAGLIVMAKDLYYTGDTIMIDHGYGVFTLYAHMSKMAVKKGDVVRRKQLLGLSGGSGRVTGPHLHWQAIIHHVKVNPMELTKVMR